MVFVKPLQHANVRQAERAAPFEHQADLRPGFLVGLPGSLRILRLQLDTYEKPKQGKQCSRSPETSLDSASELWLTA